MVRDRPDDDEAPRRATRAERWASMDVEEAEGIRRIFRITASGNDRIWLVAMITVAVMALPLPWRDRLGQAYGWYALVVLALGLGVICVMGARQIWAIHRAAREAKAASRRNRARTDGE